MAEADLDGALQAAATAPRLLVTLDFDGVLAPIVSDPSAARPLPAAARAVGALAQLPGTTVALVSGRGLADLAAVSGFGAPIRMVGSHGGEFCDDPDGSLLDADQQKLKDELTAALRDLVDRTAGAGSGVALEHKPAGIAVHVRNADPATGARVLDAVRAGPAGWPGVDPTEGKAVIDLAVVEVTKGSAIDVLREQVGADAVLFAGDDVTDETGFARLRPGDVGIKVGDGETAAGHRVAGPQEMAAVLDRLVELRRSG
ncbi:trehalose-phosphatase [Pseudonocardia sp. H11422]|uniref:trehalose-phosphatase n=1 Tax=Pseudonocardia sp. H11422 TaxID=2835866 RepID=UPI001BDC3FC4|nr:trehalose-phosphatase [Pseudonocardia sp. H11422]